MHDLVIRNAHICDGLGTPIRRGSLAVSGDRIAEIGDDVGPGRRVVDADGLVLAPGIIDTHTHYDAQITWDPMVHPSPAHGVTTVVIGNCGFTIAPCKPEDRDLTMRNLVRVEGMSIEALRAGIDWSFESFPQYLGMLESHGTGPNVAAFVGHSSVRTFVMGEDAPKRAASDNEVRRMESIVREAMNCGAVGFATSTSPSHNGADGDPMPSRLADEREMKALVGVLAEFGRGVFMLTKGGGTSVEYLESLAAGSGRPVVVAALLHNSTRPGAVFDDLSRIAEAQSRGRKLFGQVSCCPLTMEFSLEAPYPFEGIASWRPAMDAGEKLESLLRDADFRARVRRDLEQPVAVRLFNGEWEKLKVVEVAKSENRHFEGQSVKKAAEEAGMHPLDWLLDLSLEEELKTTFAAVLLNSDEQAVARLLTDPYSTVALSDAGAHLTFFCDAGFGLHLLGHWAREKSVMPLEEAVRRLTSHPAGIFGIRHRGMLTEGAFADLLLFDPARVNRGPARRVFDLPGGARRLTTDAVGVQGVWVNGIRIVDESGLCANGDLPGMLLKDFAA
ncbi:MAG TPA: amidohydrolase family protein [Gammaproteobacteria bacterium]|nr:amidohydrolase family protein [Gammaproteobacteria bacterium]